MPPLRSLAPHQLPDDAGVLLPPGQELPAVAQAFAGKSSAGEPRVAYPRTLLWNPAAPLRLDLAPAGFRFLTQYTAAAPIYDYDALAYTFGDDRERAHTQRIVGDLRIPVYDTRALFLRACDETEALLAAWKRERDEWPDGGDDRLAFLRAVWTIKPLLLPLPTTWIEGR